MRQEEGQNDRPCGRMQVRLRQFLFLSGELLKTGNGSDQADRRNKNVVMCRLRRSNRMSDLITADELNFLKTSPRHISWKDVSPKTDTLQPPIVPALLKSGYTVSYTIDSIFKENNVKLEHVIVGAAGFEPDPVDMDEIARAILGKCARAPHGWSPQEGRTHYLKIIGLVGEELNQFYEEGIEKGANIIEGRK